MSLIGSTMYPALRKIVQFSSQRQRASSILIHPYLRLQSASSQSGRLGLWLAWHVYSIVVEDFLGRDLIEGILLQKIFCKDSFLYWSYLFLCNEKFQGCESYEMRKINLQYIITDDLYINVNRYPTQLVTFDMIEFDAILGIDC